MDPKEPTIIVSAKDWKLSKTIIFNAIMSALVALEASLSVIQPYLPGSVYAYLSVALIVGNTILRVLTVSPLAFGAPKQ